MDTNTIVNRPRYIVITVAIWYLYTYNTYKYAFVSFSWIIFQATKHNASEQKKKTKIRKELGSIVECLSRLSLSHKRKIARVFSLLCGFCALYIYFFLIFNSYPGFLLFILSLFFAHWNFCYYLIHVSCIHYSSSCITFFYYYFCSRDLFNLFNCMIFPFVFV